MHIYTHRATVTAASGEVTTTTLPIRGGLLRYLLVRANTDTTVFQVRLEDENAVIVKRYDFAEGEMYDEMALAVAGSHIVRITNASPNDTFTVAVKVEE